jgi:type I restriction enzyme, S subunit
MIELPHTWVSTTLEDVYTLHYGKSLTKRARTTSGSYPVLGSSGVVGSHTAFLVQGPVVVVGRKGAAGAVTFCKENCWPIDTTYFVKPPNGIDVPFAGLHLQFLQLNRLEKSTAIPGLSRDDAYALRVAIPPTREQRRIVAKIEELFSELDKGVGALTTVREQLKVYRQSVLKHAFEGKLTEEWRKRNKGELKDSSVLINEIAKQRSGRIVHLPAPELPDEWACVRAEDICVFITKGTTPQKNQLHAGNGEVPFIKVYNLTTSGHLDFTVNPTFTEKEVHEGSLSRSKVFPNDVLMNIVGPPLGKVSIVPHTFAEWNINQAIAIFRTSFLRPRLLAYYLAYEGTQRPLEKKAKATAGQFNLTLEICRDIPIPVIDSLEQEVLEQALENILSTMSALEADIAQAISASQALRHSILKQAFSGQLVAQDPADEPASVLLDRIRAERAKTSANKPERKTKKIRKEREIAA